MDVIRTVAELRQRRAAIQGTLALVPTMGALHAGHLMHLDVAQQQADEVWVSVFVNPTQFGPNEDYARYPRTLEADLAACEARGASAVFCPEPSEVYPPGVEPAHVDVPGLADQLPAGLEAAHRPGHFAGVCRVVLKLLMMAQPTHVTLGVKDLQQLRVCQAMIKDLNVPTEVIEIPIVREPDGLAMSSRNAYLDPDQRQRAAGIQRALQHAKQRAQQGGVHATELETQIAQAITDAGLVVDYAVVRDGYTLRPIDELGNASWAIVTARLGAVRLLDNLRLV